ncbi:DUF5787 family protein [Natrinema salaciae]|uniref:Uncharacterized protein n=1 Tax=Natrinema salaciae TaxID=1186196 RepID=A0A1H9M8C9_9EURY|nr:DUF5787 family protein [Natrinema salaciae]SER19393.1 hypothetical protein SAMN04489841_3227 [Natrinema salaciae]
MSEFAFELELCAHLESRRPGIVARQLGGSVADPGGRILDVVCVEPGPEFEDRVAITGETIPDAAIESAVGTGRARYWKNAFDCHPERARSAVDRALEIGFFERDHGASAASSREYVRQVARYPDWYDRIVGIENKPDLGRPGDLEAQLRTDVSLALVDAVVLATESYVTRAHLNRIPEAVGVWRVHRDGGDGSDGTEPPTGPAVDVIREPTPLAVDEPGIEPLEFRPGRTGIDVVAPDAKARARRRLAERAYGKGWRTYAFPDCAACRPAESSGATLPHCEWTERVVDAGSECGSSCPGHESVADGVAVDLEAERDRRTAWEADPTGRRRRQSGLDQFG